MNLVTSEARPSEDYLRIETLSYKVYVEAMFSSRSVVRRKIDAHLKLSCKSCPESRHISCIYCFAKLESHRLLEPEMLFAVKT